MDDAIQREKYRILSSLANFPMDAYVKYERPGLQHLPVGPWRGWWRNHFDGTTRVVTDPGTKNPARGPDLAFYQGTRRVGLLGVENSSRRVDARLDALDAYIRDRCSREPLFCILWMWASCVEDTEEDVFYEYDPSNPVHMFDRDAEDGAPLIERTREHARRLSEGSDMLWILAVRMWKKGRRRGYKGIYIYGIQGGKDLFFTLRSLYRQRPPVAARSRRPEGGPRPRERPRRRRSPE